VLQVSWGGWFFFYKGVRRVNKPGARGWPA
jgi:hypothetical protein